MALAGDQHFRPIERPPLSLTSSHMLFASRQIYPRMPVVLIYGSHGMRKCRIRKRPEGDSNYILLRLHIEMNGCTTRSTEMKCRPLSRIAYADKGRRLASDLDVDPAKAGLRAERASGAALTGKTVTNRNPNRITGGRGGKLTATAGRYSDDHSTYLATEVPTLGHARA